MADGHTHDLQPGEMVVHHLCAECGAQNVPQPPPSTCTACGAAMQYVRVNDAFQRRYRIHPR